MICPGCGKDFAKGSGVSAPNGSEYCRPECYGKHMDAKAAKESVTESMLQDVYRVWWIPDDLEEPFHVTCFGMGTAIATLGLLLEYDVYRGNGTCVNRGGVETWKNGKWEEWASEDGEDIWDYMQKGRM